ncbi:MAG: hypothetical protein Q6351_009775 [Candidatus Njordarchaeum guaymaensis]
MKITYYYTPIWLKVPYIDLNNIMRRVEERERNIAREKKRYVQILSLITDLKKIGKIKSFQAINLMLMRGSEHVLGNIILSHAKEKGINYDWISEENKTVNFPLHMIVLSESTNILIVLPIKRNDYNSIIRFLRELKISDNNLFQKKINLNLKI